MRLKIEIHEQKKKRYLLYFLSKFSDINVGEGGCGDPCKDISTPRAMAYFQRRIEEHANVIATMSLPESSQEVVAGLYKKAVDKGPVSLEAGGVGEAGIF